MKIENKNYVLTMDAQNLVRVDKTDKTKDRQILPNIAGLDTITALKNLNQVFNMQEKHPTAFKAYFKTIEDCKDDKKVLAGKLDKLALQKQFAPYVRMTADGMLQLKYGLYIYAGIPHSTLSVRNCIDGKLHHTGDTLSSYSDKSNFIELDKEYYAELQKKAVEGKKTVTDDTISTIDHDNEPDQPELTPVELEAIAQTV